MATWAKGIDFKNSANTIRVGGVGVYGSDTSAQKLYLGLGAEPWNNAGLELTSSAINFKGNKIYHAGSKPTASEIGAAPSSHTHNYAGSSSAGGAANSAVQLSTSRKLTIGSTGKPFNGTADVSWSLSEIGAAAASHSHSYLPLSGGTLTGALTVNGEYILGTDPNKKARFGYESSTTDVYISNAASNWLRLKTDKTMTYAGYKIYTSYEKPTPAEIGAAATSHSHNSLTSKGTNTINSTAKDTTATWGAQGHSIHWYTTAGYLNGQPSQYGYLLNLGSGSEVHQLWMTQASGDMAHRGGNGGGWSGSWKVLLDSSNFKNYAAAASHTHSYLPLNGGTINNMLKINTTDIGFVLGDSGQEFYIKKHSSGFDMSSTGGISPHYSTNFAIYKGAPGNGQLAFQIDANKNTNVIGNLYTNRLAGYSNNDRVSIGSGNCRVDTGGNYFRLFTSAVGSSDYGLRVNPAGGISIMVNNVGKHAFNADGSKNGGSIEIEGMNYGMSPIDSPKFLIEDILFDVDVKKDGTIIELNNIFAKSINGKYGVFVNNGQAIVSDKNFYNFKVSGYTGKVDIRIVGVRIGYEEDYYKILGGFEHGIEEEVNN